MAGPRGRVHIVGAGPGDPELLTLKAARLISEADVILYDRLAPPGALSLARGGAVLVDVGKAPGRGPAQDLINRELVRHAEAGRVVVRLKGGDPLVFGRGEEECSYVLSRGIPCEMVPGVSSATGAPTCAGIPLGSRWGSSSFAVVTGRTAASGSPAPSLGALARAADTLVVMMPLSNLGAIASEASSAMGAGAPAALVLNGCTAAQRVIEAPISEIASAAAGLGPPAVLVAGAGAALRRRVLGGAP